MKLLYSGLDNEFSYSLEWMLFEMHIPFQSELLPPDTEGEPATRRIHVAEEHWVAACSERDGLGRAR